LAGTRGNHKLKHRRQGAPTIADVAAYAGFAPMTVSRVINGENNVRQETREAVQAAIVKLKYSPNLAARTLAGAEQVRIGLLYSNPSSAYLSEFLVGSLEQARLSHVQLVVEKCDAKQHEEEVVRELLATGSMASMLPPPLCDSKRIHAVLTQEGRSRSPWPAPARAPAIGGAHRRSCRGGCHDPAYPVVGPQAHLASSSATPTRPRARSARGYRSALGEAGIAIDKSLIGQGLFTYRSGLEAAGQILNCPAHRHIREQRDMGAATVTVAHRLGLMCPRISPYALR
jgi:LacI family transcriptional regulator